MRNFPNPVLTAAPTGSAARAKAYPHTSVAEHVLDVGGEKERCVCGEGRRLNGNGIGIERRVVERSVLLVGRRKRVWVSFGEVRVTARNVLLTSEVRGRRSSGGRGRRICSRSSGVERTVFAAEVSGGVDCRE